MVWASAIFWREIEVAADVEGMNSAGKGRCREDLGFGVGGELVGENVVYTEQAD